MESAVPRILKTPILAMYHDDKHENLTLEVELPDVENENITLVMHENSFYLKACSKNVEYLGSFFLDGPVDPKRLLQLMITECLLFKFLTKNVSYVQGIFRLTNSKKGLSEKNPEELSFIFY